MLSLEQLSQAVKEHLAFINDGDSSMQYHCKWTIAESSLGGRGIIATEDIKSGEVLFVDHPLIYGPRVGSNLPRGCTVCRKLIDSNSFYKCSNCALLLCSEQCQNTPIHSEDCAAISRWNNKMPIEEVDDTLMSRALTAIRALLLNEDQRKIMTYLQANQQSQHGREVKDIMPFFDIPKDEENLMVLACRAFDTNAFEIATQFGKNEMSMRGLYPVSGLMNHACVPNTRHSYNAELQMMVHAVKPIRAGSEIFSCYSGILWGTPARRAHLYKTKHFLCKCERCADPTERGTLLAALKCFSSECQGVLLPIDPLKLSTPWRCIECDLRVPHTNISAVQGALGSLMSKVNFSNVGELESFLVNRITKLVPRTNQIVVDLHCRLIWMLGDSAGLRWHRQEHQLVGRSQARNTAGSNNQQTAANRKMVSLKFELLENLLDPEKKQRNWTIKKSELGGRGLFAAKPIKNGTLIFKNKPLAVGPRADNSRHSFCTVCYKLGDTYECAKCSLPLCSNACEVPLHAKLCDFVTKHWTPKADHELYSKTLCSVLFYLQFMVLEDRNVLGILQRSEPTQHSEEIRELFTKYVVPEHHRKLLLVAHSILKINSFRIANNTREKNIPLRGLYPISSFLNHSCVPNTRNIFTEDYTMSVFATKPIEMGEEITTTYTAILWSTPARRCQLFTAKRFWCKCMRCGDATEMGTKLSALKCLDKNCLGALLPTSPLDPGTEWSCEHCLTKVPANKICFVQSALGSLIGTLDLDDQLHLDAPVLQRLAKFIPYYSHIFVDLRLRWALRVGSGGMSLKELSESRVALKESLCRGSLRTLAALGAGDAHLRGLLLYHLHAALAERARRSPDLYDELKSEIESSIEQAYHILLGDISAPPDLELRRRYLGPGCDKPRHERFFILDS